MHVLLTHIRHNNLFGLFYVFQYFYPYQSRPLQNHSKLPLSLSTQVWVLGRQHHHHHQQPAAATALFNEKCYQNKLGHFKRYLIDNIVLQHSRDWATKAENRDETYTIHSFYFTLPCYNIYNYV